MIREAMRGKGMVAGPGRAGKTRTGHHAFQRWDKGLMGTTLRYPYDAGREEIWTTSRT